MKKWPAYKNYFRACRNTTEVIRYFKELGLEDYCNDDWYLKNYVRDKGIEYDYDDWVNTEVDDYQGVSIQIEYIAEYDPRKDTDLLIRFAAYDKEANGEKVVEPARYEVRVTKYTQSGLDAQEAECYAS